MGLSLNAEQKSIIKIFKIEEQYIIPNFQRPYSWEYDHCFQLYNDLIESFKAQEDYFLGNIIIVKSDTNKELLEIIDGQQRLITLLLLIKSLFLLFPKLKVLQQILEYENWEGNQSFPRIKSNIFEANDNEELQKVLSYSKEILENRLNKCQDKKNNILERKCSSRFEANILYFYHWFVFYQERNNDLKFFIEFLLKRVFLLPIELTGKTHQEANEKALVIFETINNRGLNLEDADIFKTKLYEKSRRVDETEIFIELWKDIKYATEKLRIEIDDLFRYYSHIIRGKEGIISSEINLREFFTIKSYSPFELKKYKEVLDDLFQIIEILNFYENNKKEFSTISKWIQLIDIYTNQYPKFAVVAYFFTNGIQENNNETIHFLQSLVRYIYYQGSTTKIKFEIYSMIRKISTNQPISEYYYPNITLDYFDYLGGLKYGYALLAFYLNEDNKFLKNYYFDKLLPPKKNDWLDYQWNSAFNNRKTGRYIENYENYINRLGNFIVLDISPKKNLSIHKKLEYYATSDIEDVKRISQQEIDIESFSQREHDLKQRLVNFFRGS